MQALPPRRTLAAVLLSSAASIGCGSDSAAPPVIGSGGVLGTGGIPNSGGASNGGVPNSGGASSGGGTPSSGGASSGGVSGTGGASGTCETAGTWAILFDVGVTWPAGGVLTCAGASTCTGRQQLRLLSTRTVNGTAVTDQARVCDVTVPKFSTIVGDVKVEFPPAAWDTVPVSTTLLSSIQGSGVGATFTSEDNAIIVGATLANPATAPWPDYEAVQAKDDDGDGKAGVTAISPPPGAPTSGAGPNADKLHLAFRTIAKVSGQNDTCDKASGTVVLKSIEQAILGCHVPATTTPTAAPEGECSASQTKFLNANAPKWAPGADSKVTMVRLAAGATCAQVRSAQF